MTPPEGPATVRRGLSDDQALQALSALMYTDAQFDAEPAGEPVILRAPERELIAA
jgi:hypothetical protein